MRKLEESDEKEFYHSYVNSRREATSNLGELLMEVHNQQAKADDEGDDSTEPGNEAEAPADPETGLIFSSGPENHPGRLPPVRKAPGAADCVRPGVSLLPASLMGSTEATAPWQESEALY